MNSPSPLNEQALERIVREVLARLQRIAAEQAQPSGSLPVAKASSAGEPGTVNLTDRVVTLEALKAHWPTMKRLHVRANAVITPAARDELRERKVIVQCGHIDAGGAAAWKTFACRADARAISAARTSPSLRTEFVDCDPGTFAAAGKHALSGGRPGVITTKPALALCELNRRSDIRAVAAAHREALQEAIRDARPNVIVLDPRILNAHQLVQQLEMFTAAADA